MTISSFIFRVLFCKAVQKMREGILFATIISSICIAGKKIHKEAEDF